MSQLNYLEKLLDGVEVEWSKLGDEKFVEIANSGRKPVKSSLRVSGKIPYYGANNIQDYVEGYTHDGEFLLIATLTATVFALSPTKPSCHTPTSTLTMSPSWIFRSPGMPWMTVSLTEMQVCAG